MIGWIRSRVRTAWCVTRDFFAGLATGLFVLWMMPRMAHGMGIVLVIGCLTALIH